MGNDKPRRFEVAIDKGVLKRLRNLPPKHKAQIVARIRELDNNPRPHDSIKLKGEGYDFRIDQGSYRLLYDVDYQASIIWVRLLMNRDEGYARYYKR